MRFTVRLEFPSKACSICLVISSLLMACSICLVISSLLMACSICLVISSLLMAWRYLQE